MTFKTEQEAIDWVKYNLPWTVTNSNGKPVFPFISLKVFDEIANHLGKELFKREKENLNKVGAIKENNYEN